jgi:nicotinamidase-related amidase
VIPEDTESFLRNVVLLVVDMQPGFLKAIPHQELLLRRTAFAIEAANLFGLRTLFTEQNPQKLGHTHPLLIKACEVEGDESRIVFPKLAFNALAVEPLMEELHHHEVNHILLTGIETPICIYQTALAAIDIDIQITLLTDCVGGRRSEDAGPVLSTLESCGCYLLPSESVFYSLLKSASHPAFKELTRLVKFYSNPLAE